MKRSAEFLEGYQASKSGKIRSRNPYDEGTEQHAEWHEGWKFQFHGNCL